MDKNKRNLDDIMIKSGFLRTERTNRGKTYIEFSKDGFVIDKEDIIDEWSKNDNK